MKKEEMDTIINGIRDKLGEEQASVIGDDLASILSDNSNMNDEITMRDNQIQTLKKDKENLITANGNLFKQVSLGIDEKEIEKEDKPREKFSYRKAFDEKGNFI